MLIKPNWPAPEHVQAFTTTRTGGVSKPPFDSLNLALHVNDNPHYVALNRQLVTKQLPSEPVWLNQTHSNNIAFLDDDVDLNQVFDASMTCTTGKVCAVMTADCLPVLITNEQGTIAAAVHAGWQGLANKIIIKTIIQMVTRYHVKPSKLLVWLGPAISQRHFEIDSEVKLRLQNSMKSAGEAPFVKGIKANKWYADVYQIAREQLAEVKVTQVYGGDYCTYADEQLFYSHRRATHHHIESTGRMVSVINLS